VETTLRLLDDRLDLLASFIPSLHAADD